MSIPVPSKAMPRLLFRLDVNIIFSITLVRMFGFPLINPALPTIRDALNISNDQIGWVMTAFALPAFVCMPLSAYLSDRYGRVKVIAPSLMLFAIAGVGMFAVEDFESLIALRVLQGVGASSLGTLNIALVGDIFSGRERSSVMGYVAALQNGGSGILPVIGGALALLGWYVPFMLYILAVPVGLLAMWKLERGPKEEKPPSPPYLGHAWQALSNPRVLKLLLISGGFIFVGFGAFVTYIPIFLSDRFGVNEAIIGLVIAARTIPGVAVASQFGRLTQRFPLHGLIAFAFLVMAVSMATVPLMPNAAFLLLTGIGYGVAFAIIRPGLQLAILDAAPDELRGAFSAAHGLSLRIAQASAPVLAGLLLLVGGLDHIYIVGAVICLALMVLTLVIKKDFVAPPS